MGTSAWYSREGEIRRFSKRDAQNFVLVAKGHLASPEIKSTSATKRVANLPTCP
jgi:hypothetical protein